MGEVAPRERRDVRRKVADLATPCLLLDRGKLMRNLARMTEHMGRHDVMLRPHLKTAKSIDVARLALAANFGGIAVSTLNEARYFFAHGIRDITYAVGLAPAKLDEVLALCAAGADIGVLVDDADVVRGIAETAPRGASLKVLIEVDTGGGRGGVAPTSEALLAIARLLDAAPGLDFRGVLTHAGQSYACRSIEAIAAVAEGERAGAATAAQRLRESGVQCPVVSVGSTPTALHGRDFTGVTEVRAGVYMFMDLFQAGLGVCDRDDLAVSVLTSVIGRRPADNRVLIDAGALALSLDRSTAEIAGADAGYGLVCDERGRVVDDLSVVAVNQEHGFVAGEAPLPLESLEVGARLRILPNHACMTAAMHERYNVIDGEDDVAAVWQCTGGW